MACGLSGMQFLHLFSGRGRACNPRVSGHAGGLYQRSGYLHAAGRRKHGATFYDQNNQRKDPIAILKENGVNYVRLRLWVDPQSASGEDYGGGNNDLVTTLALAKRAKAQGMKLLLDFHYSDFWTDPGKQFKPKAWEKLDYPQLKTAIHDYTRDTIARFKQAGVLPDMVQIGNEINGGILWPEGKSWGAGRRRVRPAGWPAERGYRWPEGEPAPGRAGENHAASGRRDQERYLPLVV